MWRVARKAGRNVLAMAPIPVDHAETFRFLSSGSPVIGFPYGSEYLGKYLKRLKPSKLEHLIAIRALYRPGIHPKMINEYIGRKNKRKSWSIAHPLLKPIIGETFGLWLYQQQIVRAAVDLGGLTVDEASALWKKSDDAIEKAPALRDRFILGATRHGIPNRTANNIFRGLLRFGPWTFDREHLRHRTHIEYAEAYIQARYMKGPSLDPRREMLDWN